MTAQRFNHAKTGLILLSVSFGASACLPLSGPKSAQWQAPPSPAVQGYAEGRFAPQPPAKPFVKLAQANALPPLRGLSPERAIDDASFPQSYSDYRQSLAPTSARPIYIPPSQTTRNIDSAPYSAGLPSAPSFQTIQKDDYFNLPIPRGSSVQFPQSFQPSADPTPQPSPQPLNAKLFGLGSPNAAALGGSISSPEYKRRQPQTIEAGTSIDQSLTRALAHSPLLAIEDLRIQEAEESLEQAKAQGRFRLNFEGNVGAGQNETVFSVVDRTDSDFRVRRSANLDLSLPLYQGGRIKAQKNVAKTGIKAAKANYDAVQTSVTQDTAIAHLNVQRDRELIQIYSRNLELLTQQKQTIGALVRAGENTLTDEALLDARLASLQVRVKQSEADLAASESNYKKLTGRAAPALMPVPPVSLPSSLQEIKEAAQQNNALIKAGQTRAETADYNIALAQSFGRPRLALQGVLRAAEGQSDTIRRNSAAEVLLNLSVPLLSGGENKSRVRQAALAQSRALLETRALQDNLNERIEQLWAAIDAAQRSQAPNQAQKIAGQKAYEAITKQREAGVATLLDVLSVEQTLLDAELNLVQAKNREDVSRIELLGLMGVL